MVVQDPGKLPEAAYFSRTLFPAPFRQRTFRRRVAMTVFFYRPQFECVGAGGGRHPSSLSSPPNPTTKQPGADDEDEAEDDD